MTSKFVSSGGAEIKAPEGLSSASDEAWQAARKQVEERKKPKDEGPVLGIQEGGKSLYEHLQDQKAAKQEAFEEATKLRNQFRPLDESEVEFLEGIKHKERVELASVRNDTAEQLRAFRKEQAAAEQLGPDIVEGQAQHHTSNDGKSVWKATKKRRRLDADEQTERPKSQKVSSPKVHEDADTSVKQVSDSNEPVASLQTQQPSHPTTTSTVTDSGAAMKKEPTKSALGLVSYDSDSDG
ncbi:hypothetical protein LTR05_001409 [Lithohypha guttulata]|uniref:FAM192A/Fyv6 N-terminal domain-containing protein n=1 Tax=Lithohypha guttulata TaxID=1690604 RepID=A0AAN7T6C3_9EURO|nr:hypothetical protein LTR05_001409 [Lithohypha guttulata]